MRIDRRWWLLLAAAVLAGAFLAFDLGHFLDLQAVKGARGELQAWRDARSLAAAAIFFAVYVAATAFSVPGAAVLTLVAGALFGLGWGTLIVSFASAIGATLAFLSARWLLRDWVQARFGRRIAAIDEGVGRDGGFYLFTLRLVPLVPFFLINLAMGLTALRTVTYYWVSQLGMLPGTLLYVNAGTQLARVESLSGIVSPSVLGSLVLLGVFPLAARKALDFRKARRACARWTRPQSYDRNLVVIGAGSAGLVSAYIAAAVKAEVTLVESGPMGGDCLNTGCVPSKALIRSARVAALLRRGADYGLPDASGGEADFRAVMERVQRVVAAVAPHDSVERFGALGVDVVQGRARIVTPWEVEIARHDGGTQRLTTRAIVVATGARPLVPDLPGIEQVEVLTSENLWRLRERPGRLLVLGGGPIGCELAQAFARLGCEVTQVEQGERLLSREDPDVSELIAARLRDDGVRLLLGHEAVRVEVEGGDKALVARSANGEARLGFDALLVALGRVANVEGFGLEELGVETGRTVGVDGYLRTSFPNILAAGDAIGPYQFTHTASHEAWYAAVNGLFAPFWKFRADYRVVPRVTYTDPEVAHVGLDETEAKAQGIEHEVTLYRLDDLDRAIAEGETEGFVKVLTAAGSDRILGATVVGAHAGELLAEWTLAMKHGIGLGGILGTIHAYPTLAESAKYVAGQWRLAHAPRKLLAVARRFHAWRRGGGGRHDDAPAPAAAAGTGTGVPPLP